MKALSVDQRQTALEMMARDGVEVLVVGGGITGAGVSLDAVARGYKTALIEKADFASGTSSKSTKLSHGGIRYLAHFDFALVKEALEERGRMIRNAPHLVKPLGFVLPLYKHNKRPMDMPFVLPGGIGTSLIMQAGLLLYDLLSGKLGIQRHRRISIQTAQQLAPALLPKDMTSAFVYYDGQTDDTLLTMSVLRTAAKQGALLANYTELLSFDLAEGVIVAANIKDVVNGQTYRVPVKQVVNAAGVFAGRVEALAGKSNIQIKPAKGVHLTVPREKVPIGSYAVVLPETPDNRLVFLVPWHTRVTIGTTDTKGGNIDVPVANRDDIDYLLEVTNAYLQTKLTKADVVSAWAGYRPLIAPASSNGDTSKLSRTHVVNDGPGGMITITGGKLTTYRRMAQDTVDRVDKHMGRASAHPTESMPLDGAPGRVEAAKDVDKAALQFGWNADVVQRVNEYGQEACELLKICTEDRAYAQPVVPDLPYVLAEVVYACRYEMAIQLDDMLARRLHLNFEDWTRGVACAPAVAEVMGRELGWSAQVQAEQVARYRQIVTADQVAEERPTTAPQEGFA